MRFRLFLNLFWPTFFLQCNKTVAFNQFYWTTFTKPFKEKARTFFIKRAEKKGIPWNQLKNVYQQDENNQKLKQNFDLVYNKSLQYPSYFLKPFHGYEEGNMNWEAAYENSASTLSISSHYWKNTSPEDAAKYMRNEFINAIENFGKSKSYETILDIGCSIGKSTEVLEKSFPMAKSIQGVDLSPYFLSVGMFHRNQNSFSKIEYSHQNAEKMHFSSNSFDLVSASFLFHEVPRLSTLAILKECLRTLKPGGTIAILDLDPFLLQNRLEKNIIRKIFFESTEPHIYEYYTTNFIDLMKEAGFSNISRIQNDPYNSVWIGKK